MYKVLLSEGLGVAGRQNELIELGLTHRFGGVEIDMADLLGRYETLGKDFACQFLLSAKINMGTFLIPVSFDCSDEDYAKFEGKLEAMLDLAKTLGCKACVAAIAPKSKDTPFQENFEKHRLRLLELGQKFAEAGVRIGLGLRASKTATTVGDHDFIRTAEEVLTLVKSVGSEHVGLCLDTFEWTLGGGTLEQLKGLDINTFTEIRLADVADGADHNAPKPADRIAPGDATDSIAVELMAHLIGKNYQGQISVATNQAMFSRSSRNKVVDQLSSRLDKLIAQEPLQIAPPVAPATEEEAGATAEATDAAPAEKTSEKEAGATVS